jgi:hypothetical protein
VRANIVAKRLVPPPGPDQDVAAERRQLAADRAPLPSRLSRIPMDQWQYGPTGLPVPL